MKLVWALCCNENKIINKHLAQIGTCVELIGRHHNTYIAGGGGEGLLRPSRDDVRLWVGIWCHSSELVVLKTRKSICNIILDTSNVLDTNIEVIVSSTKI